MPLVALLAALVPLLVAPGWFLYFDSAPKACVLLAGSGALLLFTDRFRGGFAALWRTRLGRWYFAILLASAASLLVSSASSPDPALSLFGTGWRRLGAIQEIAILAVAAYAAALLAMNPPELRVLLRAVCGSGALIAAYAAAQYLGWDPIADSQAYRGLNAPFAVVRPPGTLGHAAHLGNYMVFVIGAAAALARMESRRVWRWLAPGSGAAAAAAILLSGTRSAMLGAAIAALVLAVAARPSLTARRLGVALALLLAAALFYGSEIGAPMRVRAREWIKSDARGGARIPLWKDSLVMARAHLWKGFGPEIFGGEFPRFESAETARAYPNSYFESPHNLCLEALIAQGLPGLLLSLALLALAIRSYSAAAPITAAAVGLFVAQQFVHFVLPTFLAYHLAIAIAISSAAVKQPRSATAMRMFSLRPLALPGAAIFFVVGAQILLVDAGWASIRRALGHGDAAGAISSSAGVRKLYPPEAGAELWYSRAILDATRDSADRELRAAAWNDAIAAAATAARSRDNRASALYNLATLYWSARDLSRAEDRLRATIRCSPVWYKPHWLLAETLSATGRPDEASAELRTALSLAGAHAPAIAESMSRIAPTNTPVP